jgi:hypothetical protein
MHTFESVYVSVRSPWMSFLLATKQLSVRIEIFSEYGRGLDDLLSAGGKDLLSSSHGLFV